MPLVIVTGYPCSGKTRRAEEVAKFMREKGSAVQVVNNESLGIVRNSAYKDSASEKPARAALKAAVERHLSGDSLMICDDLNYIKGFRYELYCMARALGTSCTTIHCDATVEQLCTFNQEAGRGGGEAGGRYEDWILEELPRRFERPNDRNRWERPLFVVRPEDGDLPFEDIAEAIQGQKLKANLATANQPISDKNLLHQVDAAVSEILAGLHKAQANGGIAGRVTLPRCTRAVDIYRVIPIGEQRTIKRQFIKVMSDDGQAPGSVAAAADMFLDFLLQQIRNE